MEIKKTYAQGDFVGKDAENTKKQKEKDTKANEEQQKINIMHIIN